MTSRANNLANFVARMRRFNRSLMTDSCTISRPSQSLSGSYDVTETWTVTAADVPCRVVFSGRSGRQDRAMMSDAQESTWIVKLPYDQTIGKGDRIVVNGSVTLDVMDAETHTIGAYATEKMVIAELVLTEGESLP